MNIPVKPAILLFQGKGIISSVIRWQTRGIYSHAAFLCPDGHILESWQGHGVRTKFITDWEGIDAFDVEGASETEWTSALSFAQKQVGKRYDYLGVLRFLSRRRMLDNERWFCSELVYAAMLAAGVHLLRGVEPWMVSPSLLGCSPKLKRRCL